MPFDPSELIGGLGAIAKLFIPSIENSIQQKFETEFKDRLSDYQNIISMDASSDRDNALGAFINRLCIDAGSPAGFVQGESIEVPLAHFQSLVAIAAGKIRDDELLARISFKSI